MAARPSPGESGSQPDHPRRPCRPRDSRRRAPSPRSVDTGDLRRGHAASPEERRGWRRFWLVDPLDGTKEFIKHRDEFTVNVGLIEDGEPVLGVVLAPALDLLYWAVKGEGAWRQQGAGPAERIFSRTAAPGTPLVVVESLSHPSAELEEYLATIPGSASGQGRQLAQVLLGRRRARRPLPPAGSHDGVGCGGGRLHLPAIGRRR